ncbi:DUF362 domain-containing protein [Acidobacteriota bacterium]
MKDNNLSSHYVCTLHSAEKLIKKHNQFWVSNCGCREGRKNCRSSRLDVCLFFTPDFGGTGTNFRVVDNDFVSGILKEAQLKHLVPRPFVDKVDSSKTLGICFCCSDCCSFFQNPKEVCARGSKIEETDHKACIACGTCVDVCYFNARKIEDGELVENKERCYGCGLCADTCPMHCIQMLPRTEKNEG